MKQMNGVYAYTDRQINKQEEKKNQQRQQQILIDYISVVALNIYITFIESTNILLYA